MKNHILIAILIAVLLFTVGSSAQSLGFSAVTEGNTENVEVRFPAPPDRHFIIFEAVLPAANEADCMAARDFSTAVPVGPDRATVSYDRSSGVWYLRNSNTTVVESCRVLLVRSSAQANSDLTLWRARYGSTLRAVDGGARGSEAMSRSSNVGSTFTAQVIDPDLWNMAGEAAVKMLRVRTGLTSTGDAYTRVLIGNDQGLW